MKFLGVVVFATTIAAVFSAALLPGTPPQEEILRNQIQEYERYLRDRRSSYPGAYYAPAPCGAAPVPAFHLAPPHHTPAFVPSAIPHYGYPAYRDNDEAEMMSFSDFDPMQGQAMNQQAMFEQPGFGHMPMARYAYGPAGAAIPALAPAFGGASAASAAAALAGINAGAAAAAAPAIGVFPNANVGGCSVPLLLSCSPSIKPGHIVKSHGYSYGGGEAYRGVDQAHEGHDELAQATHEPLAPAHDATSSSLPMHQ